MEIRITHHEDRPRAGFALQVRFQDPQRSLLSVSSPTWAGLQVLLEHVITGRHPRTTHGRRDCELCRREHRTG